MGNISNILKSLDGNLEFTRVLTAASLFLLSAVACGLTIYKCVWVGESFDITAFCLAYGGAAGGLIAGGGTTAAFKDRKSADTKIVTETGAVPVAPPAGPPVPVAAVVDDDDPAAEFNKANGLN